jgi:hypothetical protein
MAPKMAKNPLKLVQYTNYTGRNTIQLETYLSEIFKEQTIRHGQLLQSTDTPDTSGEQFDVYSK